MYLLGVVQFLFVCFLAIDVRTVQADEPLVSLARDDADMMFSRGDRRRGWWKKVKKGWKKVTRKVKKGVKKVKNKVKKAFRLVKRFYYKTHPQKLRACKKNCLKISLACGKFYGKCLAGCTVRCYASSKYRTYTWKKIQG